MPHIKNISNQIQQVNNYLLILHLCVSYHLLFTTSYIHSKISKSIEAHLELLVGSSHEEDHQLGLAHVMEHVSLIGNSHADMLAASKVGQYL